MHALIALRQCWFSSAASKRSTRYLDLNHLMDHVGNRLPVAKWKLLADHLGLDISVTDQIEGKEKDPVNCIRQVFISWEKSLSDLYPYEWETVIRALKHIKESGLAKSLEQLYI